MVLSEKQKAMIVAALCGAILDLKMAKLEARRNGFKTDGYKKEINEYVELKKYIVNDKSDKDTDK